MGEEILDFGPVKDTMQGIIKVIGVGGGGGGHNDDDDIITD